MIKSGLDRREVEGRRKKTDFKYIFTKGSPSLMLNKVHYFYLSVVDHSLCWETRRCCIVYKDLSGKIFRPASRMLSVPIRCCFNQTKMETFASSAQLGTNQAHLRSSKNSIYCLNLNCIVRDLSIMYAC